MRPGENPALTRRGWNGYSIVSNRYAAAPVSAGFADRVINQTRTAVAR